MSGFKILVIDDEPQIRTLLHRILSLEGFDILTAVNAEEGLEMLAEGNVAVVLTDVKLPGMNGIALTSKIRSTYPNIEVVVLTAFGQIKDGVEAMKLGAFDYLVKGDDDDKVPLTVRRAYDRAVLSAELNNLRNRVESKYAFSRIIGKSKKISEAIEFAKKVAPTDTTVLLLGETGTGKELFAQAIHNSSPRKNRKFVAVNCSAIPKDLQESEFFGFKKGAFTGAIEDKAGLFGEADGGTIFLDEVGDMSLQTQAKLLRTIEERTFFRLGDPREHKLDIRIIAATNHDLNEEINAGNFRQDLFYRLNTFSIYLPSLKERLDDIDILIRFFAEQYSEKLSKNIREISPAYINRFKTFGFKGNIRELKNIIERSVILAPADQLTEEYLPEKPVLSETSLESVEKKHILKVLAENKGNKTKTAKSLGIGTVTLYRKLKEYGIE
jgi:two-component system, NtrC family, response regulator